MCDTTSKADRLIKENAVMVFSKMTCGYCKNTKKILEQKQKEYEAKGTPFSLGIYELDENSALDAAIQDHLEVRTKKRTVPRIFVANEPLGGNSDLMETLKNGAPEPLDSYWLKRAVDYTAAQNSSPKSSPHPTPVESICWTWGHPR